MLHLLEQLLGIGLHLGQLFVLLAAQLVRCQHVLLLLLLVSKMSGCVGLLASYKFVFDLLAQFVQFKL